ncbi:MAG: type II secretion system F family protein [Pseudomonadales bacterium]|nr:type II secretion system F family protein [Pseudomonadales bacterium]
MATNTPSRQTFTWTGKDRNGNKTSGEMDGMSVSLVKAQLRKQGVLPTKVKKKAKPLFGARKKAIKPMDIANFTRQLATMMKTGVPLVQSFEIVADGLDNRTMAELVEEIKNDVAGGDSFASAIAKHPKYFDDLFCSLVGAGEDSGSLDTMLDRVATYKEKTEAMKTKVKKAMKYPITIILISVVVTAILLIKVVPTFENIFASFGAELPVFTRMVISLSEFVQEWWFMAFIAAALAVAAYQQAMQRSEKFVHSVDRLLLKMPIIGPIINQSAVARFARTLSTTFAAGVPLVNALDSVAGATGNIVYEEAVYKIRNDITSGQQLQFAMKSTGVFPSMLIQMVGIGEESGTLDEMLDRVATRYEDEVDDSVDSLSAMMEPLIMSVLGVLVGGLVMAMYLPIFQMGNVV